MCQRKGKQSFFRIQPSPLLLEKRQRLSVLMPKMFWLICIGVLQTLEGTVWLNSHDSTSHTSLHWKTQFVHMGKHWSCSFLCLWAKTQVWVHPMCRWCSPGSSTGVFPHIWGLSGAAVPVFLCFPAQGQLLSVVLQLVINTFLLLTCVCRCVTNSHSQPSHTERAVVGGKVLNCYSFGLWSRLLELIQKLGGFSSLRVCPFDAVLKHFMAPICNILYES